MSVPAPFTIEHILLFALDGSRFALDLAVVERVERAVELTTLPEAPPLVLGIINVHGRITPVVDLRQRLQLPPQQLTHNVTQPVTQDVRFVLTWAGERLVAIVVDAVLGVRKVARQEWAGVDDVVPGATYLRAMVKLEDGLILICDLDQFLSHEDEETLQLILEKDLPPVAGVSQVAQA